MASPSSSRDVVSLVAEVTNQTPENIRNASAEDRKKLIDTVVSDRGWPKRFREHNISTREQLSSAIENSMQKGWFDEYVKGEGGWLSLGTIGKVLTMKPVEGVVNAIPLVNKIPFIGKIARAAAIGASIYFGIDLLKKGAEVAYNGGNILLDRIGVGGGYLTPPMDLPAAPYQLQPLPSADPWATA